MALYLCLWMLKEACLFSRLGTGLPSGLNIYECLKSVHCNSSRQTVWLNFSDSALEAGLVLHSASNVGNQFPGVVCRVSFSGVCRFLLIDNK